MINISKEVMQYVEENIYNNPDYKKQRPNINRLIQRSMELCKGKDDINPEQIYILAAYAALNDRDKKDDTTGCHAIIKDYDKSKLKTMISNNLLTEFSGIIGSFENNDYWEPNSEYGKILYEANRDENFQDIVKTAIRKVRQYNPKASNNKIVNYTYSFLNDAYGYNGFERTKNIYANNTESQKVLDEILNALQDKTSMKNYIASQMR